MTQPTLSEVNRNLQEHIRYESGYQIRFEEKLDAILLQTTKTNGRVSSVESWREKEVNPIISDYKENRAQIRGATKLWALIGGGILVIMGLTGTLYIKTLKAEILQEIITNK